MQFGELGEPTYIDEAQVLPAEVAAEKREFADSPEEELLSEAVDEALGIERTDRLPLSPRSGPRLSAEATKRVGARLAQERREDEALRAAGLLPPKEGTG